MATAVSHPILGVVGRVGVVGGATWLTKRTWGTARCEPGSVGVSALRHLALVSLVLGKIVITAVSMLCLFYLCLCLDSGAVERDGPHCSAGPSCQAHFKEGLGRT